MIAYEKIPSNILKGMVVWKFFRYIESAEIVILRINKPSPIHNNIEIVRVVRWLTTVLVIFFSPGFSNLITYQIARQRKLKIILNDALSMIAYDKGTPQKRCSRKT